jgi:hypothetical protein
LKVITCKKFNLKKIDQKGVLKKEAFSEEKIKENIDIKKARNFLRCRLFYELKLFS